MGGRSLRFTAARVFGYGPAYGEDESPAAAPAVAARGELQARVLRKWHGLGDSVFEDVGGASAWRGLVPVLVAAMGDRRGGGGYYSGDEDYSDGKEYGDGDYH